MPETALDIHAMLAERPTPLRDTYERAVAYLGPAADRGAESDRAVPGCAPARRG
jgi:hypothetical protein